jgi:hypothetical protein
MENSQLPYTVIFFVALHPDVFEGSIRKMVREANEERIEVSFNQ